MLKVEALLEEVWTVAKSGVSVDAGRATRIRQENSGPREELQARARLISTAPMGYKLGAQVLEIEEALGDPEKPHSYVNLSPVQWKALVSAALEIRAKAAP